MQNTIMTEQSVSMLTLSRFAKQLLPIREVRTLSGAIFIV
jgi:hypothetical protein